MALTQIADSATISTTEYYLGADATAKSLQTTQCILQVFIHIASIAAGDRFLVKFYREINNVETSQEVAIVDGVPLGPLFLPALGVGGASGAWDISVTKLAGTDRVVHWELFEIT